MYTGQLVARRPIPGFNPIRGVSSGSSQDVTVKELSRSSVEISGSNFQTFTVSNIRVDGDLWDYVSPDEDNSFSYDGGDKLRTISFMWTSPTPDGPQTVTFGGARKRTKN